MEVIELRSRSDVLRQQARLLLLPAVARWAHIDRHPRRDEGPPAAMTIQNLDRRVVGRGDEPHLTPSRVVAATLFTCPHPQRHLVSVAFTRVYRAHSGQTTSVEYSVSVRRVWVVVMPGTRKRRAPSQVSGVADVWIADGRGVAS